MELAQRDRHLAAIPLSFIVATGVVTSYPWASNLLYTVTGTQPPVGGWRGERMAEGNGRGRSTLGQSGTTPAKVRNLDELALVAKQQIPEWKSITLEVPQADERVLSVSVDTSIGGQPESASQLLISRQSGNVEKIKRFSDNNAGRKLRVWARFVHTGEEFGTTGEAIAALASFGAVMLVWSGLSMALRRLMKNQKSRSGTASQPAAHADVELARP